MRDEMRHYQKMQEQKQASGKQGGPKPRSSDGGEPGRYKVNIEIEVESEPEPENTTFEIVKEAATRVKDGLVYWYFVAKDSMVECSESVSSFLSSFFSGFGVFRAYE